MPRVNKKLTSRQEQEWNEIFNSIDMDYVPIEYVLKVVITFDDGTIWDIDVANSKSKQPIEEIEDSLADLFEQYQDVIVNIDFRLDIDRMKRDLSKRVMKFLKVNR